MNLGNGRSPAAAALLVGLALLAGCRGGNPAFRPSVASRDATVDQAGGLDAAGGTGGSGEEHDEPSRPADAGGARLEGGTPAEDAASAPDVAGDTAAAGDGAGGAIDDPVPGVPVDAAAADVPPVAPTCPAGWACLAAGSFTMGSASNESGRDDDETAHAVTITQPFWMKTTEVTQGEWRALMGNNPANYEDCGANCPVESVDWYQAIAFANAASLRDGYPPCYQITGGGTYDVAAANRGETPLWPAGLACPGYRLATEAEWEYAARAGTSTAFHGGAITRPTDCNTLDPGLQDVAWYCANRGSSATQPVGKKKPNAWGLYDMHGNVWEWLWDRGSANVDYPAGPATDPIGPDTGSLRRDRGGAYANYPAHCRSGNRDAVSPGKTFIDMGLRLVRSAL